MMKKIILLSLLIGGQTLFSTEGWGKDHSEAKLKMQKKCSKKLDTCEIGCIENAGETEYEACLTKCFTDHETCMHGK
jgi:hypothetical protein